MFENQAFGVSQGHARALTTLLRRKSTARCTLGETWTGTAQRRKHCCLPPDERCGEFQHLIHQRGADGGRTLVVDVSSTCTWLGPFVASLSRLESLRLSFGPFADLSGLRWTDIPAMVQNISLICPTPQLIDQLLTTSSASADPLSATTTCSIAADDDPASSSQPARSLPAAYESGLQRSARVFIWTWAVDDTSLVSAQAYYRN